MAGFIKEFLPVSHDKKGLYYRISDEYTHFYLQWIEPEKSSIALNANHDFWLQTIQTMKHQSLVHGAICRKTVIIMGCRLICYLIGKMMQ